MISIHVNRDLLQVAEGTSLTQVIESLGKSPRAVATAVNGSFIARTQRDDTRLKEGDVVMTFEPITGG